MIPCNILTPKGVICDSEFDVKILERKLGSKEYFLVSKAAGRDIRNHLRECMRHLRFEPLQYSNPKGCNLWSRIWCSNIGESAWIKRVLFGIKSSR